MKRLLLIALVITMMPLVLGTVTFTAPASGATINGTYTFTGVSDWVNSNMTNMTVYLDDVAVCSIRNTTSPQTTFSCDYLTTGTADKRAVVVNFTFRNVTYGTHEALPDVDNAVQNNDLDNTAPTCVLEMIPATSFNAGGSLTVDCGRTTDAIDTALIFSISGQEPIENTFPLNATPSNGVAQFSGGDLNYKGTWTFRCVATDNAGHTCIISTTILATSEDGKDEIIGEGLIATTTKRNLLYGGLGILLLGGIIGIIYYIGKKKK